MSAVEAGPFPIVSLHLNLSPDQHGRDHFEPFVRKEFRERLATYPGAGPERDSLERDAERVRQYLLDVDRSANGLALFACAGVDLFEPILLSAAIARHELSIDERPYLYPLAHLLDRYPKFAVVVADTNLARIFVVAVSAVERTADVQGQKTQRHKMGGWSQARYQRHIDGLHAQHAREVADTLARIVRDDRIESILLAGDEVILPLIRDHLPKDLATRVVDALKLDIRTPEHEILQATIDRMRERDEQTDRERVEALLGAYRANALATIGRARVERAFEFGQVDELLLSDRPEFNDLVLAARKTSATIHVIEDASLLEAAGGVGAFLRFTVSP